MAIFVGGEGLPRGSEKGGVRAHLAHFLKRLEQSQSGLSPPFPEGQPPLMGGPVAWGGEGTQNPSCFAGI